MNPRYANFQQSMFVAGDVEQFEQHRDPTNGRHPSVTLDPENNVWLNHVFEMKESTVSNVRDAVENTDLPLYRTLSADAVDNTFFYLFNKFKKGVFVKIKDRRVAVFLPFSKHNFINEWSNRIRFDPTRFESMNAFLSYASTRDGTQRPVKFNFNIEEWYSNNGLFRNEFPMTERDRNLDPLLDMLTTLCNERDVPDIEFFINRRDFPVLSKKNCEPYDHIFDADNVPLKSHAFSKYAPVLSMVTTDRHADIPMPTHEDWARVASIAEGKLFEPDRRDYRYTFDVKWEDKIACAVFRGASTGAGVTWEKEVNPYTFNPRLFAAKLSQDRKDAGVTPLLLDAGITEWNTRPRKIRKEPYLRTVEVESLGVRLSPGMPPTEQARYKYILNIDGHVSAFRLSLELSMGSVVLLQEHTVGTTNYRMWFHRMLQPYVHYVPVKKDLSDVLEKIEWCTQHDDECRQMAENARAFYEKFLTRDGVLDYFQYLLTRIKSSTGHYMYNEVDIDTVMYQRQLETVQSYASNASNASKHSIKHNFYPFHWRDTGAKEALRRTIHSVGQLDDFARHLSYQSEHTTIEAVKIGSISLAIKSLRAPNEERHRQLINEAFVGLTALNKLCAEVPNFRFTFGWWDNSHVVSEFVPGVTWDKFLAKCSVEEILFVLMQCCLALMVAQERCGFVHNDLNGWNIVIRQLAEPIEVTYAFRDRVIRVKTTQIPVFIDYGRAHVIHENCHFGQVHPFKFTPIQDCFCLMISTLSIFMATDNDHSYLNVCLDMVNFFTMTHFHPASIRDKARLFKFLKQYKKYNEMLYAPKHSIEKYQPMHLFDHLLGVCKKFQLDIPFEVMMYPVKCPRITFRNAPSVMYAIWMRETHPEPLLERYLARFATTFLSVLDESPHIVCLVAGANRTWETLEGMMNFITRNIGKGKGKDRMGKQVRDMMTELQRQFDRRLQTVSWEDLTSNLPDRQSLVVSRISARTFAIPSRLLTVLQSFLTRPTTFFADLHDLCVYAFLYEHPLKVPWELEKQLVKAHRKLITFDPLIARNNCASVETIQYVARQIYPEQIGLMEPYLSSRLLQAYEHVLHFHYMS